MIKCTECGGSFELSTRTRRRVIYKCVKCGRELPVRKHPSKETKPNEQEMTLDKTGANSIPG